jgi:hypothetical protein
MIDRTPYYRGLNIPQIETLANLDEQSFQNWINRGASVRAIDVLLEEKNARAHKGQTPPGSAAATVKIQGKNIVREKELQKTGSGPAQWLTPEEAPTVGEFGLQLRPSRAPNSCDIEQADSALAKFLSLYQQVVPSESNLKHIANFLHSRGAVANAKNLQITFEQLWGQLELRIIEKGIETAETKLTGKRGERVQVAPYHFAKPVRSELFETVLSPADVRALSSADVAKMMKPMTFPSITSSASDYVKSEEFRSENPEPQSRASREQSEAQILREAKIFLVAHPQYDRYFGDPEHFGDLYRLILGKIEE